MKNLNSLFHRNSDVASISNFEKFAMTRNLMNNVLGGDGGVDIILDDDPHTPPPPPPPKESNP